MHVLSATLLCTNAAVHFYSFSKMSQLTDLTNIRQRLQTILAQAPKGWHGTTYPNDFRYRGRGAFVAEMVRLLQGTDAITKEHLDEWYPEDYVRLGSPFSTLLEIMNGLGLILC